MFLLAPGQHLMKAFSPARLNVNSRDAPVMAYFARVCMPVLFLNCTCILLEDLLVGHLNNRSSTKDNHTLQSLEVPKTFRFDNAWKDSQNHGKLFYSQLWFVTTE